MSRKGKYTPKEKELAVIDYIDGNKSRAQICIELLISTRTIQDWVGIYRKHGINGFQSKKRNKPYSKEFKIKVVEEYMDGHGSSIDLALKYNISSGLLRTWIRMYNSDMELKDYAPKQEVYMASARRKTTIDERKEIVMYSVKNKRDYKGTAEKYDVSYSQVYSWVKKYDAIGDEVENEQIAQWIKEYDINFKHTLGYQRMRNYINRDKGKHYSKGRIQRIMRVLGIKSIIRKQCKPYRKSTPETIAKNTLHREFEASKPNQKWATDVTEFKVPMSNKKIYLGAILDFYDITVISYVLSNRNNNKLVFDTYDLALKNNPDATPLFHSDRGFQYTSKAFQQKLHKQ